MQAIVPTPQQNRAGAPVSVTVGVGERGQKIYALDVNTQSIHNMPMLSQGGESIAASWKLSSQTPLNMLLSQYNDTADLPFTHRFRLRTAGFQVAKAW